MTDNLPALLRNLEQAIERAQSFDEVKSVRDQAETLRAHYGRVKAGVEAQNHCAAIKLRAERRMGAELARLGLKPGRPQNMATMSPFSGQKNQGSKGPAGKTAGKAAAGRNPTLAEIGVAKKQSERWQLLASIPERAFETHLIELLGAGLEITTAGALRLAKALRVAERVHALRDQPSKAGDLAKLAADGARFGAIYADPAWRLETYSDKGLGRSVDRHYRTMTIAEICEMGPLVQALAAPDCALLMWVYDPLLDRAFEVISAWGFSFKTVGFRWFKDGAFGNGYWTREGSEECLLATRGHPKRLNADVSREIHAPRGRPSEKPEGVAKRIERLVGGPYLELFARKPRKGWTVWGDEAGG